MEKRVFSRKNCRIFTDDSCCLSKDELVKLHVKTVPFMASQAEIKQAIEETLREKDFVLFVGTAPSFSALNETIQEAVNTLNVKDKSLNAEERVKIVNTSSFSGGLGFFVTLFANFMNYRERTEDEADGFSIFLANHIMHFFIEPSEKKWNNLIYAPRTGPINYAGGKYRGNKGIYSHLAKDFHNNAYNEEGVIWICYAGKKEEARSLAKQFKHHIPDSRLDLTHQIVPNTIQELSENLVSCFYLSTDVRPDEPNDSLDLSQYDEIEEKRQITRANITNISKYGQAFKKDPNPTF